MSKKLTFTVTLEFADKINDDKDVLQVAENIARAIVNETNGEGVAPQDIDTYLEKVSIKPKYIQKIINQKVY